VKAARCVCRIPKNLGVCSENSSSGRIEAWKSSEEVRGSKSSRGNKLRRVDAELFGQEPFRAWTDGRNPRKEKRRYPVGHWIQ
jgi:hypothetical protein